LPERLQEARHTGSSALIQETDAEDFSRLLRLSHSPTQRECDNDGDNPTQF
jgi:hypothetical protein